MVGKAIYFPSLGWGLCLSLSYNLSVYCCSSACCCEVGLFVFIPDLPNPQIYLLISSFNSIGKSCPALLALCRPKNPVAKWRELFVCEPVNFWSFLKSCLPPLRPNKKRVSRVEWTVNELQPSRVEEILYPLKFFSRFDGSKWKLGPTSWYTGALGAHDLRLLLFSAGFLPSLWLPVCGICFSWKFLSASWLSVFLFVFSSVS